MSEEKKKQIPLNQLYKEKPDLARARAYEDYMLYQGTAAQIAKKYGIPNVTFQYWLYKQTGEDRWKEVRDAMEDKYVDDLWHKRSEDCGRIVNMAGEILKRVLARYMNEPPSSIEEAQKIASIFTNVHRVYQLQKEKPTSISLEKAMTNKSAKEIIAELNAVDELCDYEVTDDKEKRNDREKEGFETLPH